MAFPITAVKTTHNTFCIFYSLKPRLPCKPSRRTTNYLNQPSQEGISKPSPLYQYRQFYGFDSDGPLQPNHSLQHEQDTFPSSPRRPLRILVKVIFILQLFIFPNRWCACKCQSTSAAHRECRSQTALQPTKVLPYYPALAKRCLLESDSSPWYLPTALPTAQAHLTPCSHCARPLTDDGGGV